MIAEGLETAVSLRTGRLDKFHDLVLICVIVWFFDPLS
jgi:hypothetical protein